MSAGAWWPTPGNGEWAALSWREVIAVAPTITREELRSYLGKVSWPASNVLIASFAKQHGAPGSVLGMLDRIPSRLYMSERDLWEEVERAQKAATTG